MGPCVSIMVLVLSVGYVLLTLHKIWKLQIELHAEVLEELMMNAPKEIQLQLQDNINWIKSAGENKMVVGSQARILYADAEGRMKIAEAFNNAIADGTLSLDI